MEISVTASTSQTVVSLVSLFLHLHMDQGQPYIWNNRLCNDNLFLFCCRSLIYPFLIRGGKATPFISFALAFVFCVFNGYVQIRYLSHYAEYSAHWVTHPCFITGRCSVAAATLSTNWFICTRASLWQEKDEGYPNWVGHLCQCEIDWVWNKHSHSTWGMLEVSQRWECSEKSLCNDIILNVKSNINNYRNYIALSIAI